MALIEMLSNDFSRGNLPCTVVSKFGIFPDNVYKAPSVYLMGYTKCGHLKMPLRKLPLRDVASLYRL